MQTLQPSIKSGRNVWNNEALPQEEFQSRVHELQAAMTAKGLDLAFVYGRAFNGKADQAYLTNFVVRLAGASAVAVPREGAPAFFFEGAARGLSTLKRTTWVETSGREAISELCAASTWKKRRQSRWGWWACGRKCRSSNSGIYVRRSKAAR